MLVLELEIGNQQFAIRADLVEQILNIAAWTPLANMPNFVVGVLAHQGQSLAVVDARACLGLATAKLEMADHLLLVNAATRFFLWVDQAKTFARVNANDCDWLEAADAPARAVLRLKDALIPLLNMTVFDPGQVISVPETS